MSVIPQLRKRRAFLAIQSPFQKHFVKFSWFTFVAFVLEYLNNCFKGGQNDNERWGREQLRSLNTLQSLLDMKSQRLGKSRYECWNSWKPTHTQHRAVAQSGLDGLPQAQIPCLRVSSCLTLNKQLTFLRPPFPQRWKGDNSNTYLIRFLWGMSTQVWRACLGHSKCPITENSYCSYYWNVEGLISAFTINPWFSFLDQTKKYLK